MKIISKRSLIITALLFTLLTGSVGAWYMTTRADHNTTSDQALTDQKENQDNNKVSGPTDQEKKAAEEHKTEVVKQQDVENNPTVGQKTVTPVITSFSQTGQEIFASGYVPGVFEDGGICTFAFTRGSLRVTKTSKAFANASTTNCTNTTVARTDFAENGSWSLTIAYDSSKAKGVSQTKTFTVK